MMTTMNDEDDDDDDDDDERKREKKKKERWGLRLRFISYDNWGGGAKKTTKLKMVVLCDLI